MKMALRNLYINCSFENEASTFILTVKRQETRLPSSHIQETFKQESTLLLCHIYLTNVGILLASRETLKSPCYKYMCCFWYIIMMIKIILIIINFITTIAGGNNYLFRVCSKFFSGKQKYICCRNRRDRSIRWAIQKVSRIARRYGHRAESKSHMWKKIEIHLKKETVREQKRIGGAVNIYKGEFCLLRICQHQV
jgi:hypothetical protein